VPSLGWTDTIAFLILPVLLVVSQFVSMELMQPKTSDPAQQQSNIVLKILPLMIGWFALNVPAELSVYWYWIVNNIVTTASSVFIRGQMKFEPSAAGSLSASSSTTMEKPKTIFAPPREKPSGFSQTSPTPFVPKDGVKPITAIDAEIVTMEKSAADDDDNDDEKESTSEPASESKPKNKKKGKR
jgi:YidC/Oxa1 family membrane protein insertase